LHADRRPASVAVDRAPAPASRAALQGIAPRGTLRLRNRRGHARVPSLVSPLVLRRSVQAGGECVMTAGGDTAAWLAGGGFALAAGEIHVWRVPLAPAAALLARLARTLGDDERERAARFHFERDRTAFTAARGALRMLAGGYLGHPPEHLVFAYRDKGKPYLAALSDEDLRFNVSHSGDLALLAFARCRELGVDIERRREVHDLRGLAELSFSRHEYAAWCSLPPRDQPEAFFTCWARKEAFIKATGEGISQLADFDVTLRPGEPAQLLRVDGESAARPRWSMHDLPAIPGYATALVVEAPPGPIVCRDWPPTSELV
jgi:4'-phosphopantetheinyl transferase